MHIEYTGRHYQVDDGLREHTTQKLDKVLRFVDEPIEVRAVFEVEKHRHRADLHLSHRHGILQATEEANEMHEALNAVVEKLEKQARRSRQKHHSRKRRAGRDGADWAVHWPLDVLDGDSVGEGRVPRVVKTSQLPIKPMTLDEAALQLQDAKNEFFVFRDATSDKVSVLYRRKDQNFGLIVPEL